MPRIKRRWGPGSSAVQKVQRSSSDAKRDEVRESSGSYRLEENKENKKKKDPDMKKIMLAKSFSFESFTFDISGIGRSGRILSCPAKASLLRKKWKKCFWIHLCPATLGVFSSEDNFKVWRKTAAGDPLRDKLLMWHVNFDSMGFLEKKLKKIMKKEGAQLQWDKSVQIESKKNNNCPAGSVYKYNMMDVNSKKDKKGSSLYSFKLERWSNMGTQITASFASVDPQEIKALRRVIKTCVEIASKPPEKSKKKDARCPSTIVTVPSSTA